MLGYVMFLFVILGDRTFGMQQMPHLEIGFAHACGKTNRV